MQISNVEDTVKTFEFYAMDKKNTMILNMYFSIVFVCFLSLGLFAGLNGYIQSMYLLIFILFSGVAVLSYSSFYLAEKIISKYKVEIRNGEVLCFEEGEKCFENKMKNLTKIELFKGSYANEFISLEFKDNTVLYFNYRDLVKKFYTRFNKKNIQNNDLLLFIEYIKTSYISLNDKGKQNFWKKYFGIVYFNQFYFKILTNHE